MTAIKKTLFSTDIWLDDWSDLEETVVELSYQLMKNNMKPMEIKSEEMQIFINRILNSAKEYARSVGYTDGYIVFNRAWARVMTEPSHFIPNQSHFGTWMVGTFYVTDGQGDICLVDPRGAQDFYRNTITDYRGEKHGNCNDYYYTPQKMHAIFFPGYLMHMVTPSQITDKSSRVRLAISWNLDYESENIHNLDESRIIKI
jgi:hypothetical protein